MEWGEQVWLSEVEKLSDGRIVGAGDVRAGNRADEASFAAVEMGVGEDRTWPHCRAQGAVVNGKSRGV